MITVLLLTALGCGGGTSKAKYSDFDTPKAASTKK
jgi:hypothetical protein